MWSKKYCIIVYMITKYRNARFHSCRNRFLSAVAAVLKKVKLQTPSVKIQNSTGRSWTLGWPAPRFKRTQISSRADPFVSNFLTSNVSRLLLNQTDVWWQKILPHLADFGRWKRKLRQRWISNFPSRISSTCKCTQYTRAAEGPSYSGVTNVES